MGGWSLFLIRYSARSLVFTLDQQTAIYEELTKEPHKQNARAVWIQHMDTLRVLLNNGLYEATPPIVFEAIRFFLADRGGISIDKLPGDLATKMSHIESYDVLAHLYEELEKVCQRIGFEAIPDRDYLVPLIIGSVAQLEKLVSQPLAPELLEELTA